MLIEVRIGPGKWKLKKAIEELRNRFDIRSRKVHRVPHISLFGPFNVSKDKIGLVRKTILEVGSRYSYLPFIIDGFDWFQGEKGKVIYFKIIPSDDLRNFRYELSKQLLRIVPSAEFFDKRNKDEFQFHITLASN
jgi:2'-5' RNA ligase